MIALVALSALGQNLPLPPLPYDYTALEPAIDEQTMRTHHLSHHQTYTDKLNAALTKLREDPEQKHLAKLGVDTLLTRMSEITDPKLRTGVRNAGGGYVNHALFFSSMSPEGGGDPDGVAEGPLALALETKFGSVERFKQAFTLASLEVFGSGWAWLIWDDVAKTVKVTATANQDTPVMYPGATPLLGLDLWEHAYYLKHQSRRKDYIADFWTVVNWPEVAKRYDAAVAAPKSEL